MNTIITPSSLLEAVEEEKSQREWELSKYSYWELVDELRRRKALDKEFTNHYGHNVSTVQDPPYCTDCEVEV